MPVHEAITCAADAHLARAQRFRAAALPLLDDAYRFARALMRNQADAEDAVQQCYLLAFKHFDSLRGAETKPWLLQILRNVCYTEFSRRSKREMPADAPESDGVVIEPIWQEPAPTPEAALMHRDNAAMVRSLVDALPPSLREVIVLREFDNLSYREIAAVAGTPVGTVMSRLSRARAMLCSGWTALEAAQTVRG